MKFTSPIKRGINFYRLYGARRFCWAVLRKIRQHLGPPKVHPGAGLTRPGDPYAAYDVVPSLPTIDPSFRPAVKVMGRPKIAIIGDLNLPQCRKYRVMQKLEALGGLGISADYSHWEDVPRSMGCLQLATFVIFYRTRMGNLFKLYIKECERLKIPFSYDIDDPIFSEEIYRANKNLDHLDPSEMSALLDSAELHLQAMLACNFVIVSTPRLQREAQKLTNKPVFLWRNAVDEETINALSHLTNTPDQASPENGRVGIVYASGSRAHEADFREIEAALSEVLDRHPNVQLTVIGYLNLPDNFARFEDRIVVEPFIDYVGYMEILARSNINIIPLIPDDFNDCKSAIRYMEASLVKLPTVASKIGDFQHIIDHGRSGFLASSDAEWKQILQSLILDQELRNRVGAAAEVNVVGELVVAKVANELPGGLQDLLHAH